MEKEFKEKYKEEKKKARKTSKYDMSPAQYAMYKKGKRVAHRNGFFLWLAANAAIAGASALGGLTAYNYLTNNYSPTIINGVKKTLDTAGNYLYNYIYYKSTYALESGKSKALAEGLNQMLDKFDEIKKELDEAKEKAEEIEDEINEASGKKYNFAKRLLNENEKQNSAKFIVDLYANGESKSFDIQTFQWGSTFNFDINTVMENGEHTFSISLAADDIILQQGHAVFGAEPVMFDGNMYNKYGINGIKSAVNLITNVVGDLQTAIHSVGIDGNNVSIEQMTNFFQEEDYLNYLLDAGIDLGVNLDRIKEIVEQKNEETDKETNTTTEEQSDNEEL